MPQYRTWRLRGTPDVLFYRVDERAQMILGTVDAKPQGGAVQTGAFPESLVLVETARVSAWLPPIPLAGVDCSSTLTVPEGATGG